MFVIGHAFTFQHCTVGGVVSDQSGSEWWAITVASLSPDGKARTNDHAMLGMCSLRECHYFHMDFWISNIKLIFFLSWPLLPFYSIWLLKRKCVLPNGHRRVLIDFASAFGIAIDVVVVGGDSVIRRNGFDWLEITRIPPQETVR